MHKLLVSIVFACSAAVCGTSLAQAPQRLLPQAAQLGFLGDPQPLPLVQVGGKTLKLSPGGVIYDQQNRSIVHASLPPNAPALYTVNGNGDIQRLYILTDDERARVSAARR